ncbi:MAG: dTDP-4-dehydrorhamnose reductase, partial [uncultured bacterium]
QIGSPTYTKDLARFLIELVKTEKYGIYHATNEGFCSWHGFAAEILKACGLSGVKLYAVPSEAFERPADRPKNSRLLKTALYYSGFEKFRTWQEALIDYLSETGVS